MPSRKTSRLIFGPSDSSYRKTQTFATINDSVETQKVVRRTLSVSGMGTIRAFYLATHLPAPQKKPVPRANISCATRARSAARLTYPPGKGSRGHAEGNHPFG